MNSSFMKRAACLILLPGLAHSQPAAPDEAERRNWFEDPFFQERSSVWVTIQRRLVFLERLASREAA